MVEKNTYVTVAKDINYFFDILSGYTVFPPSFVVCSTECKPCVLCSTHRPPSSSFWVSCNLLVCLVSPHRVRGEEILLFQ
jgi:hypothetical protein